MNLNILLLNKLHNICNNNNNNQFWQTYTLLEQMQIQISGRNVGANLNKDWNWDWHRGWDGMLTLLNFNLTGAAEWTEWTCLMKTVLTVSFSAQDVSKHIMKFCVFICHKICSIKKNPTLTDVRKLDILLLCAGIECLWPRRCWCNLLLRLFRAKRKVWRGWRLNCQQHDSAV